MAWYDDPITVITVAVVIIAAAGIVIYTMRRLGKKSQLKKPQKAINDPSLDYSSSPFRIISI